jgi:hypothetical protein
MEKGGEKSIDKKGLIRCFRCCSGIISFFSRINKNRYPSLELGKRVLLPRMSLPHYRLLPLVVTTILFPILAAPP